MFNRLTAATNRKIILWCIGLISCFLQVSILEIFKLFSGICIVLPIIISISVFENEFTSAYFGLTYGLIIDCFFSPVIAFNAIIFTVIGCACGLAAKLLFNRSLRCALILSLLSSVVYYSLYFIVFKLSDGLENALYYIKHDLLRIIGVTFILVIPFYYLIKFVYSFSGKDGKRRCRKRKTTLE